MNCLLVLPAEVQQDGSVLITGERAREVHEWHDLTAGISIRAGVEGGKLGRALVQTAEPQLIKLQLTLETEPPARLPLELIVAVSRPPTLRKVIHLAASCGIASLHFVRSSQTQRSYLSSKALVPANVQSDLRRGLEQGCDTVYPSVDLFPSVPALLAAISPAARRFLADMKGAPDSLVRTSISLYDSIQVAIGPESGWADREKASFMEAHFVPVGLGPRMQRVEFACALLIGEVLAARETGRAGSS